MDLFCTLALSSFATFLTSNRRYISVFISYSVYALGIIASLIMISTICGATFYIVLSLEFTLECYETTMKNLFCITGVTSLVTFSWGMGLDSPLDSETAPIIHPKQKTNNDLVTTKQQHNNDYFLQGLDTSRTKQQHKNKHSSTRTPAHSPMYEEHIKPSHDPHPESESKTKTTSTRGACPSKSQDCILPESTKTMEAGDYFSLTKTEAAQHIRESEFQTRLGASMRRKTGRSPSSISSATGSYSSSSETNFQTILDMAAWSRASRNSRRRSGRSTPENTCATPDSDFQANLRMTMCSNTKKSHNGAQSSRRSRSGRNTPESECSTPESEFQAGLRMSMILGPTRRKTMRWRSGTSGASTPESVRSNSNEESAFQAEFCRAMWSTCGRKVRGSGSSTSEGSV